MSSDEQDRPGPPSADDVTDPALQAEIGNPAASNPPTGADATPGDAPTAADEGPLPAPGAPGELHSDETPAQDEGAEASPEAPADGAAPEAPPDDETGVEGIQGPDAVDPAQAEAAAAAAVRSEAAAPAPLSDYAKAPEARSAAAPEQPPAPEGEGDAVAGEAGLPLDAQTEADAAAAETTPVAPEERAGDDVPPPPALGAAHQEVADALREALGEGAVVDTWARETGDLWVRVDVARWRDVAEAARGLGFTYFCFLSAIDWLRSPFGKSEEGSERTTEDVRAAIEEGLQHLEHGVTGGETRFQLLARVHSIARGTGIVLKADLPDDGPVAETWSGIYAGANWHERETHEMFGIGFAGHPYLVNLYLPGAFEGHPLRKDFPLLAREVKPWPGIVDVEAMPGEPEDEGAAGEEPATAGAEG